MLALCFLLAFTAPAEKRGPWEHVRTKDGITLERRTVEGLPFYEYRTSMHVDAPPKAVIDALWGPYLHGPRKHLTRRIVREGPAVIVSYDVVNVPVVSTRDYAVRFDRVDAPETNVYQMRFHSANEEAPPSKYVRIGRIEGEWTVEPSGGGGSEVSQIVLTDVGGLVPAFLAHGGQSDAAVDSMRILRGLLK